MGTKLKVPFFYQVTGDRKGGKKPDTVVYQGVHEVELQSVPETEFSAAYAQSSGARPEGDKAINILIRDGEFYMDAGHTSLTMRDYGNADDFIAYVESEKWTKDHSSLFVFGDPKILETRELSDSDFAKVTRNSREHEVKWIEEFLGSYTTSGDRVLFKTGTPFYQLHPAQEPEIMEFSFILGGSDHADPREVFSIFEFDEMLAYHAARNGISPDDVSFDENELAEAQMEDLPSVDTSVSAVLSCAKHLVGTEADEITKPQSDKNLALFVIAKLERGIAENNPNDPENDPNFEKLITHLEDYVTLFGPAERAKRIEQMINPVLDRYRNKSEAGNTPRPF